VEGTLRILVGAWVAVAGAAVGSFLNVVVARLPAGESVVTPRSRCPSCRQPIAWYDNLPVLSWFVLRGRCRRCGARISFRYPVVEAAGAAAALVAWHRHGFTVRAAVEFAFVAFLLALSLIDLDRWELPHELTRPLLVLGLAASALSLSAAPSLRSSALGAAAGFAAFWLVMKAGAVLAKREAMGEGDVWLLSALGAFLGAGALVPVVLLASIQGSVVGIALAALGKGTPGAAPSPPEGERAVAAHVDSPSSPSPPEGERAGERPVTAHVDSSSPSPPQGERAGAGERGIPEADRWVPPRNAVPFGPFLAAGALEWLWLGGALADLVPALHVFR
jgi:leader peptidase (prepilin peptidase)/N-methyltransferase